MAQVVISLSFASHTRRKNSIHLAKNKTKSIGFAGTDFFLGPEADHSGLVDCVGERTCGVLTT
jgi:hypothetical protein